MTQKSLKPLTIRESEDFLKKLPRGFGLKKGPSGDKSSVVPKVVTDFKPKFQGHIEPWKKSKPGDIIGTKYSSEKPTEKSWKNASTELTTKLLGGFLKGMDPNHIEKIVIKARTPKMKGAGLLKFGGMLEESVFNGRTIIVVGEKKMVFEAISTKDIHGLLKGYSQVGIQAKALFELGWRPIYENTKLQDILTRAAHEKAIKSHVGRRKALIEAMNQIHVLIKEERTKTSTPINEWKQTVKTVTLQAAKTFDALYEAACEARRVNVRVKTERGEKIVEMVTKSVNDVTAAQLGFQKVFEQFGISAEPVHAFVGANKVLYEAAKKTMGLDAPRFADIEKVIKAAGMTLPKSRMFEPTKPKVDKKPANGKGKNKADSLVDRSPGIPKFTKVPVKTKVESPALKMPDNSKGVSKKK